MRVVRPILLCALVVGIGLTLALGTSTVGQTGAGAQSGYGDVGPSGFGGDTVPPHDFTLAAVGIDNLSWSLIALIAAVALGIVALVAWALRTGRLQLPGR